MKYSDFDPKKEQTQPQWLQLVIPTRAWVRAPSHFSPLFCQALMLHRWLQPNPGLELWTMKSKGPVGTSRKLKTNRKKAVAQKPCQPDSSNPPRHSFLGLVHLILKKKKQIKLKIFRNYAALPSSSICILQEVLILLQSGHHLVDTWRQLCKVGSWARGWHKAAQTHTCTHTKPFYICRLQTSVFTTAFLNEFIFILCCFQVFFWGGGGKGRYRLVN